MVKRFGGSGFSNAVVGSSPRRGSGFGTRKVPSLKVDQYYVAV